MQKTPSISIKKTLAMLLATASIMPVALHAQQESGSTASREIARRIAAVKEADKLQADARVAYQQENYQEAHDKLRAAISLLPNAPILADRRAAMTADYANAAVALAGQFRKVGKSAEARALIEGVLAPGVDPENGLAKKELSILEDPIQHNPVLTFKHTQDVDKVRRTLYNGEGYYNLGKFDEAKKEFEKILLIDPYNSAARRWMERVAAAKTAYYRSAYDHARAELLSQVDKAWELAVPMGLPQGPSNTGSVDRNDGGSSQIIKKLNSIILPTVNLEDTTLSEAIDFLRMRCKELDTFATSDTTKGINFVIPRPRSSGAAAPAADGGLEAAPLDTTTTTTDASQIRIPKLFLTNVPVSEALRQICEAARMKYRVGEYAVSIVPISDDTEEIIYRVFTVPPDFLTAVGGEGEGGGAAPEDPFATPAPGGASSLKPKPTAQQALINRGVPFSEKASASYNPANSTLIVRNTATNMELIEEIVRSLELGAPKQIKILTKFVEISQENSDELGFDWIVAPFSIGGGLFPGGGTVGNGPGRTNADFLNFVGGESIDGIPLATGTNVTNIVTGSNRSGSTAITRDSIDAILNNPTRTAQNASVAPGILSLTGLFTDGQVQMIMRGLAQKKGADIMTAPSIMAKSGQKAKIEIIREFIYPIAYEPPQIPQNVGGNFNGGFGQGGGGGGGQGATVTPATPVEFETRNTGVTMEIEPTLSANNSVIELTFAPEIVEFEGFINYGSPIQSPSTDALGNPTTVVVTENRIEMPVFSVRRVNTTLSIYDGHTIAVGGLMREDVQNVEDKVPILGDIPIVGRLFQTKAENRIKSNLIVFVTAQVIDATGAVLKDTNVAPTVDAEAITPVGATDLIPPVGVLPMQ